jgi:L-fuconolactonase
LASPSTRWVFPGIWPTFLTILTRYPDMRTVIDHCMKPKIRKHSDENFRFWADGMARLAETGAFCKFSALVTEAGSEWTVADLKPYAEHVFRAFGADRVMWGSDWPVCRLRCEYGDWRAAAQQLTAEMSEAERARIFGGTASEFYGLGL